MPKLTRKTRCDVIVYPSHIRTPRYSFCVGLLTASLVVAEPAISQPDIGLGIWLGAVSNPDNESRLSATYGVEFYIKDNFEFGKTSVGYKLDFGGEVERSNKWRLYGDVGDLEVYAERDNWGRLTFTTEDRCDGSDWISGSLVGSSATGAIGGTSSFNGTDSDSAFRCAGGDGSNNHFKYTNELKSVEYSIYYDPWQRYGSDFAFGPDVNEDAAQLEFEAQFAIGAVDFEIGINEFKDIRAEAYAEFGDTPFNIYAAHERSKLKEEKAILILGYEPEEFRFLESILVGYEKSNYEDGDEEDNQIIQFKFSDKKWEVDIGIDARSDIALETAFTLNDSTEFGFGFSKDQETKDKSYEIGVGISF